MKGQFIDISPKKMHLFMALCQHQTLTKTGKALGMPASAVKATMDSVEKKWGEELYFRKDKRFILTRAGERLLNICKKTLDFMDNEIDEIAKQDKNEIYETLTIAATMWDSQYLVPPAIKKFEAIYPNVCMKILSGIEYMNFSDLNIDILIGRYLNKREELNQQMIRDASFHFFSTPEYLDKCGYPKNPDDIKNKRLFIHDFLPPLPGKIYRNNKYIITANNYHTLINLALTLGGFVILPNNILPFQKEYEKKIVPVLPDFELHRETWFFLNRKNTGKSVMVNDFLNCIKEVIS